MPEKPAAVALVLERASANRLMADPNALLGQQAAADPLRRPVPLNEQALHFIPNGVLDARRRPATAQQRLHRRKIGAVAAETGLRPVSAQLPADGGLVDAHAIGDPRLRESACLERLDVASLPVGELAVWHGHSPFAVKG